MYFRYLFTYLLGNCGNPTWVWRCELSKKQDAVGFSWQQQATEKLSLPNLPGSCFQEIRHCRPRDVSTPSWRHRWLNWVGMFEWIDRLHNFCRRQKRRLEVRWSGLGSMIRATSQANQVSHLPEWSRCLCCQSCDRVVPCDRHATQMMPKTRRQLNIARSQLQSLHYKCILSKIK